MTQALALLMLAAVSPAAASPAAAITDTLPRDPAIVTGTLPNGLRYMIRQNARPANRAELRLVVDAGSLLEDDDQRGLAHFVEHMAFNGTRHFAKQELVDFLERIGMRFGADLNASTSFDETVYQLLVPTDSAGLLETAVQILEDWAHGVTFDSLEIEKERGVVIEEWRLGQGAQNRMLQRQLPVLFRGSRYADRLPIGTRESLETFDHAALRRYYHDWYRPDLISVVAVGDFDVARVEALIRTHMGRIPRRESPRPRPDYTIPRRDSAAVAIATDREATSTAASLFIFRPAAEEGTRSAYRRSLVVRLYAQMLNDRLYELSQRPDPPFLGAGGGEGSFVRGARLFSLGAVVPDTGVATGLEAVVTEVERVERHGFTEAELNRAKQDLLRFYEQAYAERDKTESGTLAEEYVRHLLTNEPVPGIAFEFTLVGELLPGIGLDEVNHAARDWFSEPDRVLLVSGPDKPGLAMPEPATLLGLFEQVERREVTAYEETVSDAPLVADLPAPAAIASETTDTLLGVTRFRLANGVTVLAKPTDFKADEVQLVAFSPGGSSLAPDSLHLAATFASQLVSLSGLGEFSAVELQKKLAGKAVQVAPYIATYEEGLRGGASPRDLETLFQLIHLYFTAPRADPDAFQAYRQNLRAALSNRGASPAVAFQDTLTVTLAQHHPRSRPLTTAVVDSLDLARSVAVFRDRFADASDFTFVIVGSFTVDSLRPLLRQYLGTLPHSPEEERWRDLGIRPPTGQVERLVKRGVELKAETRVVLTGSFDYSRSQRFLLGVLAEVLDLKLREALREELGGTYGVSVAAGPTRVPTEQYSFSIGFGSDPARVPELLDAVWAAIDTLRAEGPGEKELEKVRETILRTRETQLRENGYWVAQLSAAVRNGEDPRRILDPSDLLALLTRDRVREAAERYLDRRNVVRVTLLPESAGTP